MGAVTRALVDASSGAALAGVSVLKGRRQFNFDLAAPGSEPERRAPVSDPQLIRRAAPAPGRCRARKLGIFWEGTAPFPHIEPSKRVAK
ncbi:hypothetical protein VTG60DRAFT_6287 [Thermothelomyces hinnuleus]